jgi:serine/threonine protein kinase
MWNRLFDLLTHKHDARRAGAHMTFAHTSIGRTVSRTRTLLKKQLWIWPIAAVILLSVVGYVVSRSIERTMQENLRSELQTLLTVERSMLLKWFKQQESSASGLANDRHIRQTIAELLAASKGEPAGAVTEASLKELRAKLAKELEPGMSSHDFVAFVLADKQQRIVAAQMESLIGETVPQFEPFLARALDGKPTVSPPYASVTALKDRLGRTQTGVPTMFVCVPVRDEDFQVVAVLSLRIRPEKEFTEILQLGRLGQTGETYAVNKQGLMVSNSRFDPTLILLGLLPDDDHAASILNVQVRNPGGNMLTGFRPGVRRRDLPLTEICAAVVSGTSGVTMDDYRDYRGSPSVGAWSWLPDYDIGLIVEVDTAEAFHPLTILKRSFYTMYALLGLSAVAIFVFTVIVHRLQHQAQKAVVEARQLGQYRLIERIGAGAMGVVYKGQHAMLRRPTAIKMLDVDRVNEASIARFEREVQLTCQLNNPHTVAIYDYGRTPEGVFYYAMEYLDGLNLQTLVDAYGPQPEGRVRRILQQVCASLYEAHSLGLVHRDIKPANIMLNRRGAEPDVVKVLDFGLVKAVDEQKDGRDAGGDMSGTPLYMPPEAIQTPDLVDARSDLYAVGAVGYFLLTGQTAFDARTLGELCQQHITAIPRSPSERLGRAISSELEHAILACLEKSRAKRPQTARDLAAMLDRVPQPWSLDDAESWWSRHERGQQPSATAAFRPEMSPGVASSQPAGPATGAAPAAGTMPQGLDRTTVFNVPDDDARG